MTELNDYDKLKELVKNFADTICAEDELHHPSTVDAFFLLVDAIGLNHEDWMNR